MSDGDPFPYRVKFTDIRVNPPADEVSRARARKTRVCDHKGCDLEGSYPAPKRGAKGKGRHHFCAKHIAEYNRSFNFFEGLSQAEAAAFTRAERFGHKRTWRFGTGPMAGKKSADQFDPRRWSGRRFFDMDDVAEATGNATSGRRSGLQVRALRELDLEVDASPNEIRVRYAEYIRRFHPDSNKGDRSSEDKLQRVLRAGKLLKAAGLMKG
ncbi:MAG: molecular chaperone DnaJ [Hyphomonas sp.]|uniref:DnaJ domain-containing protein n=1 Tax=Hyphomonas sp. TaxID=87 RepID=UPI000C5D9652|nr:J domain-containing protein [Hyphomonas sp.]MBB39379.1 molecular chaperone DnaJ [Hyphomonas sp.]